MSNSADRHDKTAPYESALDAMRSLGSNRDVGLSGAEAASRFDREGLNEVPEKESRPVRKFAGKFWGLSAWMLELIAVLSFILGKRADLAVALATDHGQASQKPESWNNITLLVGLAVGMGLLMLLEALGLLAVGWRWFDLGADAGRLQTFAFETLLFFAIFSILTIRERRPFWASRPSAILAGALLLDGCVGLLIGVFGLAELQPLPPAQIGLIVAFALVFALAFNDAVKVVWYRRYRSREKRHSPALPGSATSQ